MEYHWNENTHSNILQYLLDYNSFEQGAEFLRDILKDSFNQRESELFEKILKKSYNVYREYSIPSGRIDLFILDENEKFVIIIENKIFAEIGLETIVGNEESKKVSQLEKYKK